MPEDAGAEDPGADEVVSAAAPATPVPVATPEPAPYVPIETGYTPGGVPTFDYAREKIENRYGTAIGSAELAAETPEGRTVEEQYDARQKAAAERLAQIRESMRADTPNDS